MNYDDFNSFCGALQATTHVVQWGGSHVWKVGGKVFAIGGWENSAQAAVTFKTSELHYEILKDEPGYRPAPYFANRGMKWIQCHQVASVSTEQLEYYLHDSYRIVSLGLSKKARQQLGLGV